MPTTTSPNTLHLLLLGLAVVAYFVGSIPFGLLMGKWRGVDLRRHGSLNIGATNTGRVLGRRYGYAALVLDVLKSALPTAAASALVLALTDPPGRTALTFLLWVGVGASAVAGHIFPIFAGFKGGKGVAAGLGMLLGLWPYATVPGLVAVAAYAAIRFATGYVSVGSLLGSAAAPLSWLLIGLWRGWDVLGRQLPIGVVLFAVATMIWWRHRANIARLLTGSELRATAAAPAGATVPGKPSSPPGAADLVEALKEMRRLIMLPDNDFAWSSWVNAEAARRELDEQIEQIRAGILPPRVELEVIFAPTGPAQEVSLSSGWGDEFLKVAERFDRACEQVYAARAA